MEKDSKYYESLDKRTREYKDWIEAKQQKELEAKHKENSTTGLGDVVEKVTKATGIKKVVEMFTKDGQDCGCEDRKKKLNKITIIRHKDTQCLTVKEFDYLSRVLKNNHAINGDDMKKLSSIYERVFQVKLSSSCNGCSMGYKIDELKAVLSSYEN